VDEIHVRLSWWPDSDYNIGLRPCLISARIVNGFLVLLVLYDSVGINQSFRRYHYVQNMLILHFAYVLLYVVDLLLC